MLLENEFPLSQMAMPTNCNQPRMMIITSDEKIIEQIRTTNNLSSFETFIFECDKNNYGAVIIITFQFLRTLKINYLFNF